MVAKTRIFVVDDSALVRQFMAEVIQGQPDLQLLGAAADPLSALPKMELQWPDVILLDMEMPRMDGLTFLRQIMATHPTPVVICSSLTEKGAALTLDALAAGAVAVFAKAKLGVRQHLESIASDLLRAVREAGAASVSMSQRRAPAQPVVLPQSPRAQPRALMHTTDRIVAIGTSTGGTIALERILSALPADAPGITLHLETLYGENNHHIAESCFKALARALKDAIAIDPRQRDRVPSTKGTLIA